MSAAELGEDTIDELRPLAADRLGVLLGAGASAAAGLPGWDTLAKRLLTRSGVAPDESTAKSYLAKQDAMLAAEAARAASGDWHALIRDALYDGEDEPEPAVLHLAAAALAAQRNPGMVQLHTLRLAPAGQMREGGPRRAIGPLPTRAGQSRPPAPTGWGCR